MEAVLEMIVKATCCSRGVPAAVINKYHASTFPAQAAQIAARRRVPSTSEDPAPEYRDRLDGFQGMRFIVALSAFTAVGGVSASIAAAEPVPIDRTPFAVVELFTSQGCSSCPPADRVLRKLARAHPSQRVFVMSFHVDYWNRLGWRDPFSDGRFSDRQQQYAQAQGSNRIYTPQMIVNGTGGFIGSNERKANQQIKAALTRPPPVPTGVTASYEATNRTAHVRWAIESVPADTRLLIAVTENDLSRKVTRGENRDRHLTHDGVVRRLSIRAPSPSGELQVNLPKDFRAGQGAVVVLLQERSSMKIMGAARTAI